MIQDRAHSWLAGALGLPAGASPFPWQVRLLRRLLAGHLPRAVDLPTGLGKTKVMAVWLVARALGAPVPRRLVYLVDRRAVVDQATDEAEALRQWVERSPDVRAALGLTRPLPISTLRGQHADNRAWLSDPASPAIVVGTVDMVGSRLLFGGYGVSRKMRPYQAGLLGIDSVLVLDEAHLVPPFERLLDRIAAGTDAKGRPLGVTGRQISLPAQPARLMALSATGRARDAAETFGLTDEDQADPVVRQRLQASKRIHVLDAVEPKDLPEALARHAWDLTAQGRKPCRIIVFVNSRDHAQKVQQALIRRAGNAIELFVGGRRVHERQQAAHRLSGLGFVAGSTVELARPAFVIATSAGEVGVDLDADHAVCDLVAWERMVQRLGRVNRRGDGDASVIVVPASSEDAAVQARQTAVMALLGLLPTSGDGTRQGSPAALGALKTHTDAAALFPLACTPAPLHPPLTRALVDAWAMTSLEHHTGRPEVGPWLRGWPDDPEEPQVTIVWRRQLPIDDDGRAFAGRSMELFLDAAGPHLAERLEVSVSEALGWLLERVAKLPEEAPKSRSAQSDEPENDVPPLLKADVAATLVSEAYAHPRALTGAAIVNSNRRDLETALRDATLWVDVRLGGLSDGLLDDAATAPVEDVTQAGTAADPGPVPFRVRRTDNPEEPAAPGWRQEARLVLKRAEEGVVTWLIVDSLVSQQAGSEEGRSSAMHPQRLSEHQEWAEAAARALAGALKLSAEQTEMLAVAARLHDEGKQAARWQQALHAPNRGCPPYAKTLGRPDLATLGGYRHEFGSLPHAEAHPRWKALPPDLQELCLHLVAAHHGAARPLIRTDGADEPPSKAVERARAVALRYAALSEQWGPWGLAWWESLLRAADQQASRRNDEQGGRHG